MDIIKSGAVDWKDKVLEFMRTKNIDAGEKGFDIDLILWMLKDKEFFKQVISILRERYLYFEQVW